MCSRYAPVAQEIEPGAPETKEAVFEIPEIIDICLISYDHRVFYFGLRGDFVQVADERPNEDDPSIFECHDNDCVRSIRNRIVRTDVHPFSK